MNNKKAWLYTAIGAITLSIVSLFLPIITYKSAWSRRTTHYNILGLIDNRALLRNVFEEYTGDLFYGMPESTMAFLVILLCLIGVGSIVVAFYAIKSMEQQYESAVPFRLAIAGLVGTAIPSLCLLILYLVSKEQYMGTMRLGAYVFITPLAMLCACLAVTSKYRMSRAEAILRAEAKAYIFPAGDLPGKAQQGHGWQNKGRGQGYGR